MTDILTDKGVRGSEHGRSSRNENGESAATSDITGRIREMAGDYARRGLEFATDKSKKAKDSTERAIQRYPWYAVGIALGTGLVVGLLLRRGRSRS